MKEPVEVLQRLGCALQAIQFLDEVPECIRIEHESRTRHDVSPVAGFVLLQEKESLVLLREQPLHGKLDALAVTPAQGATFCPGATARATAGARVQKSQRDQPPERRI